MAAENVTVPDPDENWHPIAKNWYQSLAESGQSAYYEPSDWMLAYVVAESISRDLEPRIVTVTKEGHVIRAEQPMTGSNLQGYLKAMTLLLVSEGDRRRSRIELDRASRQGESDSGDSDSRVSWLDEARRSRSS
jgi:hypothetical protein